VSASVLPLDGLLPRIQTPAGARGRLTVALLVVAGLCLAALILRSYLSAASPAIPATVDATPLVAVVAGDYLGEGGESMAPVAHRHLDAVRKALEAVRIPYVLTSDSEIDERGCPDVGVIILPYNRAVSEVELGRLIEFIHGGGAVICCLVGRNDLLYAIGVAPGSVVKSEQLGVAGAEIVASADAPPGMPPRVRQPAEYVMGCSPLGSGRTVAWWSRGGRQVAPAVIGSESGSFIACGLTADHFPETGQLLRALIGAHAPGVWAQSIPSDPAMLGPYGPYATMADLATTIRRKAAAGQDVGFAVESVAEVEMLLQQAARMTQQGHYTEALEAARRADQIGARALWESFAHVEGEMRGVWMHNSAAPSWDEAAGRIARANLNAVFPYVCSGGIAYYASGVLPRHKSVAEHGDWLAEAAAACSRHGLRLHPRMLNMSTMGAPRETVAALGKAGRVVVNNEGEIGTWLCPTNSHNRQTQLEVARELVTRYDVAGVQFDYMRYPWKDVCFCSRCRTAFEQYIGARVSKWPRDAYSGALKAQFLEFRRYQLSTLVRDLAAGIRAIDPALEVSAAVFLNWEGHRDSFGQDWKTWVEQGWVDFVCPMDYTDDYETFRGYVKKQNGWVGGRMPIYAGIGVNADNCRFTDPYRMLRQVEIAREEGASGWVVFNYCPSFADDFLPVLSMGLTRKPTRYSLPPPR